MLVLKAKHTDQNLQKFNLLRRGSALKALLLGLVQLPAHMPRLP